MDERGGWLYCGKVEGKADVCCGELVTILSGKFH